MFRSCNCSSALYILHYVNRNSASKLHHQTDSTHRMPNFVDALRRLLHKLPLFIKRAFFPEEPDLLTHNTPQTHASQLSTPATKPMREKHSTLSPEPRK